MVGVRKLEHAELKVSRFEEAVAFYTDVMGLIELDRVDGTAYLGCGLDHNFDLAVSAGGTGTGHFAIRVGASELGEYEDRLQERGVATTRTGGVEPGIADGIEFRLPSETGAELVVVEDDRYQNPGNVTFLESTTPVREERVGTAPIDVDHITLMAPDVRRDAEFLRDAVGLNVSDVVRDERGDWERAFTRFGDYHHDVAIFASAEYTLHHLAWAFTDINHLKQFLDSMALTDHTLEIGIGRHGPGGNVFSYMLEPGGNRFEFTCECATVDGSTPTGYQDPTSDRKGGISIWGGIHPPESFKEGS